MRLLLVVGWVTLPRRIVGVLTSLLNANREPHCAALFALHMYAAVLWLSIAQCTPKRLCLQPNLGFECPCLCCPTGLGIEVHVCFLYVFPVWLSTAWPQPSLATQSWFVAEAVNCPCPALIHGADTSWSCMQSETLLVPTQTCTNMH